MPPAYATHDSQLYAGSSSWVGNRPSGTVQDDLLITHICINDAAFSVSTPPSGWNVVEGPVDSLDGDCRGYVYYKVAGASEPSTYTWTMSTGSASGAIHTVRYIGVDTSAPINISDSVGTAASTVNHTSPSITPSVDGCLIVGFCHVDKSGTQTPYWTPPSGYDERYDHEGGSFVESTSADLIQNTAASVSVTFTGNDGDAGAVVIVALAPVAGGGGDTGVAVVLLGGM